MTTFASHQAPTATLAKNVGGVDVVVVGLADSQGKPTLVGLPTDVEKAAAKRWGRSVLEAALDLGAATGPGEPVVIPRVSADGPRLIVVGLGEADVSPEILREATGAALRKAGSLKKADDKASLKVSVSLDVSDPELIQAVTEGALLGVYSFEKVSTKDKSSAGIVSVEIVSPNTKSEAKEAVALAAQLAEAVNLARDWVNTPANLLYPESFANAARDTLKGLRNVTVDVMDEKALAKDGYGGILAVGGGSARAPRLVRVSYNPRGAKAHLGLVGKGITFDTGGLNIKPAEGMYTMKCDMSGAAAVLAAVRAIAALGLPVQVTAYASMAENMPSDRSYRPSDVLTMFGGKTVENVNSDAEGRLVMADALVRASQDSPDLLVDVATLTGACMIALGSRVSGVMASDDSTADQILNAAETAGEAMWQLPIPEYLYKTLESKVADLKSGGPRYGGALGAAAFLHNFVGEDIPWAHLDIAGPAFNDEAPYNHVPSGGTGVAVRTLVALAASMAS